MEYKSRNNSFRTALLLATFSALGPFTVDMYLSSLPQIMEYFVTNTSMIQASLTAGLLGIALGQIIMGPLSDVHGRRKPLVIAMIFYFFTSIACAFSPNIEMFILLRFIEGLSASAGLVISRAMVRDTYSGVELTKFMSLLTTISNIAPLISPLAGSGLVSVSSWFSVFIFLGFMGIFLTSVTIWGIKETLPIQQRISRNLKGHINNYLVLLQDRKFMGYALVTGFLFAGVFAYVAGTPFIYQNLYGVSPMVFSILFAMNGVAIMLGSQLVKYLAGRINEYHIFLSGLLLSLVTSVAVLVVVVSHGPLVALVVSLFLFASSIGINGPVSFTLAMESKGNIAGSASAVLGILPYLLGAVASPLVGIAGEYSAEPFGIVILIASLCSVISYILLIRKSGTVVRQR